MFKAAISGTSKVVTANRLSDGLVIFVADGPNWVTDIAAASVLADGPELDAALAFGAAEVAARQIVDPYAVDVDIDNGVPVPQRLRELIRARGPTVDYGDDERRRLSAPSAGK